MLIFSERPSVDAKRYKESTDSGTHPESKGLNEQSANACAKT